MSTQYRATYTVDDYDDYGAVNGERQEETKWYDSISDFPKINCNYYNYKKWQRKDGIVTPFGSHNIGISKDEAWEATDNFWDECCD